MSEPIRQPEERARLAEIPVMAWWRYIIRGVLLLAFGIAAIVWPGITLQVLLVIFGILAIVEGLFSSISAVAVRERNWGWSLTGGLIAIGIGVAVLAWPGLTALAVLYLIAAWAVVLGIMVAVSAIADWGNIRHAWLLLIGGVLSFFFGIALFAYPVAGALAIVWLIGAWGIAVGIFMIGLGFRIRSLQSIPEA